jgi:hypothetical protein
MNTSLYSTPLSRLVTGPARFFFDNPDRNGASGATAVAGAVTAPEVRGAQGPMNPEELEALVYATVEGQAAGGTAAAAAAGDPLSGAGAAAVAGANGNAGANGASAGAGTAGASAAEANAWLEQVPEEHRGRIQEAIAERDRLRAEKAAANAAGNGGNANGANGANGNGANGAANGANGNGAANGANVNAPKAKAPNPLASVGTLDELDAAIERAEALRDIAMANLAGGSIKLADGSDYELTAEQARQMFTNNDAILRRHAPARAQELAAGHRREARAQESMTAAQKEYPWLANNESNEFQLFQRLKSIMPELQNTFGDWPEFVADMVAGYSARLARRTAAGAPNGAAGGNGNNFHSLETTPAPAVPERKPAPPAPPLGGGAGGTRTPNNPRQTQALNRVLQAGGDRESIAAFLDAAG